MPCYSYGIWLYQAKADRRLATLSQLQRAYSCHGSLPKICQWTCCRLPKCFRDPLSHRSFTLSSLSCHHFHFVRQVITSSGSSTSGASRLANLKSEGFLSRTFIPNTTKISGKDHYCFALVGEYKSQQCCTCDKI